MKKYRILSLAAALALSSPAFAQYFPPSSTDLAAPGSNGTTASATEHTGTDVIVERKKGRLQTMVWDNASTGKIYLAWSFNSAPSSTDFLEVQPPTGTQVLSDPDVTTAYYNDELYAAVVYLAKNVNLGANATVRTYLDIYRWDGSSFQRDNPQNSGNPLALGVAGISNSTGTANRIHSSPNIDANANGTMGVVWQETSVETAQIRVISPSYPGPSGYTFTQDVRFAESYVLSGNIDGTNIPCTVPRGTNAARIAAPSNPNPPILFNQTLLPDIAVSPNGVLSFCYISSSADPTSTPVTSGTSLVVKQYVADCGAFGPGFSLPTYSWSLPGNHGAPRIAATGNPANDQASDVEVVMAWSGGACLEGIGTRAYYEIHNWGRSGGAWRPSPTVVSIPTVATDNGYAVANPVVAFVGTEGDEFSNEYVVAWEGLNYPDEGKEIDVWSTTLKAGSLTFGNSYSRVNEQADGEQIIPSVAGRYSGENRATAYLFYDKTIPQLSFRHSSAQAGDGPLQRPAGTPLPSISPNGVIQAYPNPSSSAVNFNLHLRKGETVQQLTVVDLLGRVVDHVKVPGQQATTQVLSWQPRQSLPQGSYVVKLVTNQRTENITVKREQ
ncbi:T9SS type A sorting domain-containing protein [Hymenobacter edaphi]|uniref:Secretion system C-terminal sorting domain-containing protein n=1 Tax=Hymenobacter edaphi TaxID=2211146 RepID=A0A328BS85_9BACT|nr:T9SS type A sorting domain-containing protein [Hymenobacter edaphi]RAK67938.1 hypothetical protein DLM85_07795 [Hymenobacter edaphi]